MNESAIPATPTPVSLPTLPTQVPPVRLLRLMAGLLLAVVAFDFCFWNLKSGVGASFGLFAVFLAAIILFNRERPFSRATAVVLGLLALAVAGSVIETGFTNSVVVVTLLLVLAGQTFFGGAELWGRWLAQLVALAFAPARPFWLGARVAEAACSRSGASWLGKATGGVLLTIPALILALVFGGLLASGNAIFGSWTGEFFQWLEKVLADYCDVDRIVLWLFVAFMALPLLRPASVSDLWWKWLGELPRLPEIIPVQGAWFSTVLVLVTVNVLFFVANLADAVFLWTHHTVPAGVSYSGYVHSGVNELIFTIILSALVLTAIFQQALSVARRWGVKALALAWIGQNLFLLLSVSLRLKLYVEAYDMTVTRLSLAIFLVMVGIGLGLLTLKILHDRSLSWLLGACVALVFATFFITQFLDLAGWTANYNVDRWMKDRTRQLDVDYLKENLGPSAWPALRKIAETDSAWAGAGLQYYFDYQKEEGEGADADLQHWREFSLRAYWNSWALPK